ncbi:MAG: hypothetical protein HC892_04670 [Saprospiraceae bacterium]|nr:hypothetical protein [Saprospiraceae bacterium]
MGSGVTSSDFQFDETIIFQCDTRLIPNTRYYILIDGVTRPPDDSYGVFGLSIENIPFQTTLVQDTICAGEVFSEFGRNHSTSGIYLDTLSLPNGCDSLIELRLTVLDALQAQINQTRLADALGSANAAANVTIMGGSSDYAVIWSDGAIGNQRNNLVGGVTYNITVTDEYGCTVTLSLVTAYSNLILATASNDTLDCYGDQDGRIILNATNGATPYHFQWQQIENLSINGVGTINEVGGFAGINNLPAGMYQITFLDSINGNVQLQAQVVSPDTLSFTIVNQGSTSCYGNCDAELSFEIRGGTPPYLYDFEAERFDTLRQRLSGLCAGSFTSIITDAKACSSIFSTVVQQPEPLQIKVSNLDTVSCFGGNDGAIAVTAEDTRNFVWSNGVSAPQINGLNAGDYTVTATSNNQCSDTLTVTVPEPLAALVVQIVLEQPVSCFNGRNAQLAANVQDENQKINYKWSNGSQESTAKELSAGTYSVIIENEKGCTASDSITLTQPDELSFTIASRDLSCGETGLLGAISIEKLEGGTPTYRFSLDGVRFTPNTMFDNLLEGTYEVMVQDENGCEQSQVVTILGTSYLSLTLGEDRVINFGDSIFLQAITNSDNAIFKWQRNDTLLCLGCADLTIQPTRTEDYLSL